MDKFERLTGTINGIGYSLKVNKLPLQDQEIESSSPKTLEAIAEIMTRLAAYEDSGLTPEELMSLKQDVANVKESVDELWERQAFLKHLESRGIDPHAGTKWMCEVFDLLHDEDSKEIMSISDLAELVEARKDGRLKVPPCKEGMTAYRVLGPNTHPFILREKIERILLELTCGGYFSLDEIDKTIFLTHDAAEAELERREKK